MRTSTIIQGALMVLAMALCAAAVNAAGPPFSCTNLTALPGAVIPGTVLKMSAGTNAHGASPADPGYGNRIVCSMDPVSMPTSEFNCTLRTACETDEAGVLRLSSPSNAHASGYDLIGYARTLCCNVVTVTVTSGTCGTSGALGSFMRRRCASPASTTQVDVVVPTCSLVSPALGGAPAVCPDGTKQLVRLSATTNAHLSNNSYPYAVCCSIQSECNDGIDNDGDGYVDWNGAPGVRPDPGCLGDPNHPTERCSPSEPGCPQCDNGVDDDGDTKIDYPDDKGCSSPADEDEFDKTIEVPYCEPDCSYQIDNICHKECVGRPEAAPVRCESVLEQCDGRPVGSVITQADGSLKTCCGGAVIPALNAQFMLYNTQRDRVRATRIVKANTGDTLVMTVVSFR